MEKGHKSGRAATWSEKPIGNSDDYAIGSPGRRDEVDMLCMGKRQQLKVMTLGRADPCDLETDIMT